MKFTEMLNSNMVPEWQNKYLDYKNLDSALSRAIQSKTWTSQDKGIESYCDLMKIDQFFANYFTQECLAQLEKINTFHMEKLSEMKGKYNNLQDQLEQVLSSAIYQQIQPSNSPNRVDQQASCQAKSSTTSLYHAINYISDLFRRPKGQFSSNNSTASSTNSSGHFTISGFSTGPMNDHGNDALDPSSSPTKTRCEMFISHEITSDLARVVNSNPNGNLKRVLKIQTNHLCSRVKFRRSGSISSVQSKNYIISSYKKKIRYLKFSFRELYLSLVLLEQYTQLNHNGFEQILRKYDRMFASSLGRKFYQEHIQSAKFNLNLQVIDNLIEGVEHIYTLHFENGNRRLALRKLRVPAHVYKPITPLLDFRVGFELGMAVVLIMTVLVVGSISDTGYDWRTVFRLYRSPLLLMIFLFQTGISIVIWKHYRINHVLIFELDLRNNLSFQHFMEFASLLAIMWSISILFFLFSEQLQIRPSICPLIVVVLIAIFLFNPTATFYHGSRYWLIRIIGRCFSAPFHRVRFADFWIADQLVSIVPLFLDMEYLSCFYTTDDVFSVSHLGADCVSKYASNCSDLAPKPVDATRQLTQPIGRCVTREPQDLVIRTIVAAFPAWIRCAQCLRRWRDENWLKFHLANAAKYACMVLVVILSSVSQYKKSSFELDTLRIIWLVAAVFTSCLTAYWDVIYDFGLFSTYDKSEEKQVGSKTGGARGGSSGIIYSQQEPKKHLFLRKELVYPAWVYYFAIIENWILRFGWIITISLTEFSGIEAGILVSLLAPLEMFRRFVWNCIRLENEQLNNCGLFRAVRDIPIEVVAPIDESHLGKVIMMMDSRDGPAMRNRILKRRALRPDGVSFMVMHNSNGQANSYHL